jgi:hypothetical protein
MGRLSCLVLTGALLASSPAVFGQTRKPGAKGTRSAATPAAKAFKVELEQDGKPVAIKDHEAMLRRAPFALILTVPDAAELYVSAAFEAASLETARSGKPFGRDDFRSAIGGAEGDANASRDIMIRTPGNPLISVWTCALGRFDQVTPVGLGCKGRRSIEKVFIGEDVPLGQLLRRPLHIVFLRGTLGDAGVEKELSRDWLTLYLDTVPDGIKASASSQLQTLFDTKKPAAERTAALQTLGAMGADAIAAIDVLSLELGVKARQSAAVADLRTIVSAEAAYASGNAGLYDGPPCLIEPRKCRPKFAGEPFLTLFTLEARNGYKKLFLPGAAASKDEIKKGKASDTSLKDFILVAWPETFGESGYRAFCADSTGRICSVESATPPAKNGRCIPGCVPLP